MKAMLESGMVYIWSPDSIPISPFSLHRSVPFISVSDPRREISTLVRDEDSLSR
jgi:hypothetical protein